MKKLSELKNKDMLLIGESLIISKEDYLREKGEHIGDKVYTTTEHRTSVDAKDMLETALEGVSHDMHEDWLDSMLQDITVDDIKALQSVVDKILNRSSNLTYYANEEVDISE